MKAFSVKEWKHPSKISVSDVPVPVADPNKGEVLIDMYAAALNFFDILQSQGKYQTQPPMPFTLGVELAGKIAQDSPIPKGCPFKPGDRVFGMAQGAYAEKCKADWRELLPVPENLSMAEACTVSLTSTTSYLGMVDRGLAKPGDWVLVHGAAGGIGLAGCQIAKVLGCKVIAACSSEAKRQFCVDNAGVDEVVDYTKAGWQDEVKRITKGKGVDVVFDPVGMIIPSLKCVAFGARIVVLGFAGGTIEKVPANLLLLKQVSVTGAYWGATQKQCPEQANIVIDAVLSLLASGGLRPVLHSTIYRGVGSVVQGLKDIEERKTWGKGVVLIREEDGTLVDSKAKL
ncbi:hypothetical protein IAT38_004340 [Cryptococcus sp. DSM 104549]